MSTDDDQRAKDVLDAATRADLERWFSLPSFQQLADEGKPAAPPPDEDPDVAAVRERRQAAIAAVDPAMLEAHRRRVESSDTMIMLDPHVELRVDPDVALMDAGMIDRCYQLAEPREVELPEELRDDLRDCTPQALLRDLHRAELYFDKTFQVEDVMEPMRLDASAEAAAAMTTRWTIAPTGDVAAEGRAAFDEARALRRQPWVDVLKLNLANRRIVDE